MNSKDYQICNKCVMDTSDYNIKFDQNGICDHCQNFEMNLKKVLLENYSRNEKKIFKISKKIKYHKNKSGYDCIIGLSGGVDSSYLAHFVVKKLKLTPLVVHVDTGWNSIESVHNIEKLIDKLNLDLHTEVISWREMKDLQVAFFKASHPNLDIPQDHAIWASIHKIAIKNNIKYLLTGGNFSTECIREPLEWSYHASDIKHIKDIHSRFGTIRIKNFPLISIFKYKIYYKYFYGLKVLQPLNFIKFNKEEAISFLEKEYGWKKYSHKHYESRFTKFFEGFWLRKKFNFDVRRVHFSSLILSNQMNRNEAMELLKKNPYNEDDIENEIRYIKNKLNISDKEFQNYFDAPKKSFRDYKSHYRIIQMFIIIFRFLKIEKRLIRK